ncbi:hypothetical protein W97_04648 [Coniosporium apollinis CBS 100218]|uniref:Uncharacterized protein n=1 Tax=Coniosporium apollinis (strain CBS 100218) TaxID=1168221 RepID=R7YU36_CONA1|nr:uncharacterized protein W97_04648 [Coniosporium apollinis CBS 100218]EON65410.1 hypothetical protein W97_04648 [Coniosporium apollinis CBS 100218]
MQDHMKRLLSGTVTFHGRIQEGVSPSDAVEAVWYNSFAMEPWIQNLALAITNQIIQAAPAGNDSHYGSMVHTLEPFIHVRWLWLTFPTLIVLGSIVFLAASIWQTRLAPTRAWKSSALALLLCSVDDVTKTPSVVRYIDRFDRIPSSIGRVRVALQQTEESGWVFKRVSDACTDPQPASEAQPEKDGPVAKVPGSTPQERLESFDQLAEELAGAHDLGRGERGSSSEARRFAEAEYGLWGIAAGNARAYEIVGAAQRTEQTASCLSVPQSWEIAAVRDEASRV